MKQIILGTAGHIDHGKTSLIRALTGIDTDRLKEEKVRGITIELGFAHFRLPSGEVLGIVDVPGHEKFVKNMVAGASGIDLVALVIAADEGVMPQTREHLEICQLLRIRHGLVILTKVDLVDQEWLELVREDVSEYLKETFLADATVVEVSSVTGQGLKELAQVLDQFVQKISAKEAGHIFRIPVDRVFTIKGFGTVITGTTVSGRIRVGEDVTVYPQGIQSKIRGLQVHNKDVESVSAGLRTAINLQGLERTIIQRGDVVATKDSLKPTYMVDVNLELLAGAPRKLKNRARVRFHTGTSEIMGRAVLLDRDALDPGDACYAQIRLDAPTVLLRNDRYVLRSYSPVRAIGGGQVLNAFPRRKKKRFSDADQKEMDLLSNGELSELIETFVSMARFKGVEMSQLPFLINVGKKKLDESVKKLMAQKRLFLYDKERGAMGHFDFFEKARQEILDTLSQYHKNNPLKGGLAKEELRSRTMGAKNMKLFNHLMNHLTEEGAIVQEKEIIRLKDHQVTLASDQQKTRQKLEKLYEKSDLNPPYVKDWKETFSADNGIQVLELMVKEGILIKVTEELYFHHKAIENLKDRLVEFLRSQKEISTPQFKELSNVSRKYAIPLIEYFDRNQVTVRVGDSRILRKK